MSLFLLLAAALALQAATPTDTEEMQRFYECEVRAATQGGTITLTSRLGESGHYAWGSVLGATHPQEGKPSVTVHWHFRPFDQVIDRSYATIEVPLRKKVTDGQVMRLIRDGWEPPMMSLTGLATRSLGRSPRASASVDLDSLLAYAGEQSRLGWKVGAPTIGRERGTGYLELAPVRALVAAVEPRLAELKAKQADYKTQCTYREEPYNSDAEI